MSFTEGPRWRDGRLWFADFYTHAIYSVAEDGSGLRTEVEVPNQPSGLGWLPDGRLLYVSALDNLVSGGSQTGPPSCTRISPNTHPRSSTT